MNKKLRKLILPVSLLVASQSYGLGLGGLQVNSALDEVLEGKIPFVLDGTEEIENINVSVASVADYQRVGLDKSYVPSNIQVDVIQQDGQPFIQISSKGPVSEPIVSLLLVVEWANGNLLREYTLLLDPPIFASTPQQNYSEPVQTQSYESTEPKIIEEQVVSQIESNNSFRQSNQVVVESGDTLWKIANSVNQGSSSIQQTMVAIFNNNLDAFQNNNMNFLKKGATLTIPDSDQVAMVSNGQAEEEVKSAIQSWSRLQSQADDSTASNNDVEYGIELVPPNESDASNTNSSTGSIERVNQRTQAELNQAKEELASYDLENSELSSRVAELEQIVENQKLALSLKDTNLAQLQDQLSDDEEQGLTTEGLSAIDSDSETTKDDVWDDTSDEIIDDATLAAETNDTTEELLTDGNTQTDGNVETEIVDFSEEGDELTIQDDSSSEEVSIVETPVVEQASQTVAVKEKSLMDKLLNYKYEGLIGLGVLLLGFLGFTYFKRKGENDDLSESGGFLDSISNNNNKLDDAETELDLSDEETELDLSVKEAGLSEDDFDLDIDDINLDEGPLDNNQDDGQIETDEATELTDLDFDSLKLNDDGEIEGLEDSSDDVLESETDEEFDLDLDIDDLDDLENEDAFEDKESVEQNLEDELDLDLTLSHEDQELDNVVDDNEELEEMAFDTGERSVILDEVEDEAEAESNEDEELEFDIDEDMFATDDLELDFDSDDAENSTKTEVSIDALTDEDIQKAQDSDNTELNLETLDSEFLEEDEIDIGLDFDDMGDDDSIDTKLDLAKAYFEMGDNSGASQMVSEILEEGNDEQKAKAKELKDEIENS